VVFSEGFCWTIDSFEGLLSRRTGVGGVSSRPWLIALFDGSDVRSCCGLPVITPMIDVQSAVHRLEA
jgi:hypothetical protein